MRLCRVVGPVVSTVKHASYRGHKLLSVQPIDETGQDSGRSFLAVDTVQAGEQDRVLVLTEGNGVRQILGGTPPIRSVIVGIVDAVDLGGGRS
jgi:ethanolamine utilization protein EutN